MTASPVREGIAEVPGARLRYRLTGREDAPLLVFENGWGASYEQWAWIERELAPHARLLFYDRAGIGGSQLLSPQTVEGLSAQFAALPGALGLPGPVVAVGHSYGGLMCALHAAQRRDVLRTVVEIDSTQEHADPQIDAGLRSMPPMVKILKPLLRLGLPNFLFRPIGESLPAPEGEAVMRISLNNVASLDAGLAELALLGPIRAAIAKGRPRDFERLLIMAGEAAKREGPLIRMLVSAERARGMIERTQALQRDRGVEDPGCRIVSLPYNHGTLVFGPEGARATAAALLAFLRTGERVA